MRNQDFMVIIKGLILVLMNTTMTRKYLGAGLDDQSQGGVVHVWTVRQVQVLQKVL